MKFKVDEDKCIGCGACCAICPDVFEINDEGFAECIISEVTDENMKEETVNAMEGCPTGAINEIK